MLGHLVVGRCVCVQDSGQQNRRSILCADDDRSVSRLAARRKRDIGIDHDDSSIKSLMRANIDTFSGQQTAPPPITETLKASLLPMGFPNERRDALVSLCVW